MRNKLDEIQDYKNDINSRVEEFKKEIASKEQEIKELNTEFSKAFITGKQTDTKKINKLREELKGLKEQYNLILKAIEEDDKLKELSKEVYKEHYKHKEEIESIKLDYSKVILEKEKELRKLKANLQSEILAIQQEQADSKEERFAFIDYMNLNNTDRDHFSQDTIGLSYKIYKEREMAKQGKTVEEINEFRLKDFNRLNK